MIDKQRAIALKESGLTNKEVAQELGCSEGWCRKYLKGIKRKDIEPEDFEKLQEKLKNAERYEWLKQKAFTEDRDGGYTKSYVFPHICYCDSYKGVYLESIDKAIDSAIAKERTNV